MKLRALLALSPLALTAVLGCGGEGVDGDEDTDATAFETKTSKRIEVSLYNQELRAFEGGKLVYWVYAVTGSSVAPTPPGDYKILSKYNEYHSQKYDAEMPHTMFISNSGMAIHAAYMVTLESYVKWFSNYTGWEVFDWFGSHGCIRLGEGDANDLYQWAPVGTRVKVMDDRDRDEIIPDACVANGIEGDCLDIADCGGGRTSVPGHCPGALSVQCCVDY